MLASDDDWLLIPVKKNSFRYKNPIYVRILIYSVYGLFIYSASLIVSERAIADCVAHCDFLISSIFLKRDKPI
ncbi:hypothetical protein CI610_01852 [invertebrate metagenome]|uniref:Uncharacterized protein n=1 Tax=invertebrate metagenome TaxID=1711999 RepID=A0A2H9T7I5_9ZZZZ